MIINKDSWHYKVVKAFRQDWQVPENFCAYFRSLFFRLIGSGLAAFSVTSSVGIWFIPLSESRHWFYNIVDLFGKLGLIFEVVAVTLVCVALTDVFWEEKITPKLKMRKTKKEPNIFVEYFKAKKAKICPMLEFKDSED